MKKILSVLIIFFFVACSHQQISRKEDRRDYIDKEIKAAAALQSSSEIRTSGMDMPDFVPVKEDSSPLNTKTVTIRARNTPLRDVLYTIAETANLNLVMERYVDPELPITMTLTDVGVEDALNIIFDSADYFFAVRDNILIIKAMGTRTFEIGQPSVVQQYSIDVGGNILSGSASGGEGSSEITGDVSIKSVSDNTSYQFWDSMQSTLGTLLSGTDEGGSEGRRANFIINRMAGTIMVTATKKDLETVEDYINNLKRIFDRQVFIEARIVEVKLSDGLKYGIDWTAVNNWLGIGPTSFGTAGFSAVIDTTSPNFNFNITDNDLTVVLKALQEQGDVKTLSNPRVHIMNGQTTLLSVGRNTSFISRVETTTTASDSSALSSTTFTVDTSSILSGIMFGIVPYISSDDEIVMTITPIVTDLVKLDQKVVGEGENSVEIKLPTVDLREMTTTVKVMDGEMVIIGGLISKKESLTEDKVPLLGDIPVLGEAFKRYDRVDENTELVIMLIPRIKS